MMIDTDDKPTTQELLDALNWSKGKLSRYVTWGLMRPNPVRGSRNSFQWNGPVDYVAGEAMDILSDMDWGSTIRPLVSGCVYGSAERMRDRKQTFVVTVTVTHMTEEEAIQVHRNRSADQSMETIIVQTGVDAE